MAPPRCGDSTYLSANRFLENGVGTSAQLAPVFVTANTFDFE